MARLRRGWKGWLAARRWWCLALAVGVVCFRILAGAVESWLFAPALGDNAWWTAAVALASVAMCALAAITIVAFVQYGRIYNRRIPTE